MTRPRTIRAGIFAVGVNDRETELFEALWPLPGGISYNATLVVDEKVALVDAVRAPFLTDLLEKIRACVPDGHGLDYLVVNHLEPDHAGALGALLELFPRMRIAGNARTLDLLAAYHGITGRTLALADGETLDLGRRRLRVLLTPMVHWPETMMTLEESERVLCTGDVFGSYGALADGPFAAGGDPARLEEEARRYYANVLGKYSGMVRKALARVADADPAVLVPSHGPAWEAGGTLVRGWYELWSGYAVEPGAVVAYASMYQNTKRMAESVAEGLVAAGLPRVAVHDVSRTHPSYILGDLWRHGVLALGSPTYNTELFPAMANLVRLIRNKRMANRVLGVFGSYGWSGGALAELRALGEEPGWRLVEPAVEVRGAPSEAVLDQCRSLGQALAEAHPAPPAIRYR
jgi:flavorubredoxin